MVELKKTFVIFLLTLSLTFAYHHKETNHETLEGDNNRPKVDYDEDYGGDYEDYISYPTGENDKNDTTTSTKEQGTLASSGREFLRKVSKSLSKFQEKIGLASSNSTSAKPDSKQSFFGGFVDKFKQKLRAIIPGTKWCGDGTRARSFNDLGKYYLTDGCCREHDLCPENMAADETKNGLINTGLFTRSHCDCDEKFYNCLKDADTKLSRNVGFTYFSVLGPQCFKQDYRIVGCNKMEKNKCVEYHFENLGEKIYQWFDNPAF